MSNERIRVTYRLQVPAAEAARRAEVLALEQSIEMPAEAVTDARVLRDVVARVESIEPETATTALAHLALSGESVGSDAGQLMNMLFGNSSLHADVQVVDVDVPQSLAATFGGPRLGIAGVRALVGAQGRPLTCTALKPIGSTPEYLAALAGAFARAGLDLIKDDHGWADQSSAPFEARVAACQRAVLDANAARSTNSGRTLYLPSLFGHYGQMQGQIAFARRLGVQAFLVAPMNCGVATFNALAREHQDVFLMAHPALAGRAFAPPALLGRLFRLFGADATIFPNHGGRFSYSRDDCLGVAHAARAPWRGLKPALPVPAGGMSVERVPEIVRDYGLDSVLLVGGSLLAVRERLAERAREFVQAVAGAAP
jgi:ribulose-bisphosphate carboxylase large chain